MQATRSWWGVLGALLIGCSSNSESGGAGSGPRYTGDACSVYSQVIADRTRTCFRSSESIKAATYAADAKAACQSLLALPGTGVTEAFFRGCADALLAGSCLAGVVEACTPPAGSLADGAPCVADTQCKSRFCPTTGTCGVCTARVAIGGACKSSECAPGARCDYMTATCVALTTATIGGPCGAGVTCPSGSFCDGSTCRAAAKVGESCEMTSCDGWAQCDPTTRRCVAVRLVGEGASCALDHCDAGLFCDSKRSVCVKVTPVPAGGDCRRDFSFCEYGTCVSFPDSTARCPMLIADGGACGTATDSICSPGARCLEGACKRPEQLTCK